MAGVRHCVLNVDIAWVFLAAERDDRAYDAIVEDGNRAGRREQP